jgi:hypothetical protein
MGPGMINPGICIAGFGFARWQIRRKQEKRKAWYDGLFGRCGISCFSWAALLQ